MIQYSIAQAIVNLKDYNKADPTSAHWQFFARQSTQGEVTVDEMATNIKNRCTVTDSDIVGVLHAYMDNMFNLLKDGKIVQLGTIGALKIGIKKQIGANTAALFTAENIKKAKVILRSKKLYKQRLNSEVTFGIVPTRKATEDAIAEAKRQETLQPEEPENP